MDLQRAWDIIESSLSPDADKSVHGAKCARDFQEAVQTLKDEGISHMIIDYFFHTFENSLAQDIHNRFWKYFSVRLKKEQSTYAVSKAFDMLHTFFVSYSHCFDLLEDARSKAPPCEVQIYGNVKKTAQTYIKAIVFKKISSVFYEAVRHFYARAFHAFDKSVNEDQDISLASMETSDTELADADLEEVICTFHTVNLQLYNLDLLDRVSGSVVEQLIHERIQLYVTQTCKDNVDTNFLLQLEQWLEVKVVAWVQSLYKQFLDAAQQLPQSQHKLCDKQRLSQFLYNVYALTQIDQLFNIIIEFPDSEPALLDLKNCLEKTDLRNNLVDSLKTALETRLLHPGVNTQDILTAYISAIRALRVLDPSGVLLELVCDPVKKYLRNREDTVRCIVSSLTEDSGHELMDELIKGEPLMLDESFQQDDATKNWKDWQPDPVDADPEKVSGSHRSSDIMSMLVNIYGSKELFVHEYRALLADRLLSRTDYDTEREVRYLELLKRRFGESDLHLCEVMLKDIADSKRINTTIRDIRSKKLQEATPEEREVLDQTLQVDTKILSAQFWPSFREEKLQLPKEVQDSLDFYTKGYQSLKGNRTLAWKTNLGQVNLELELKGRTVNFTVTTAQATLIWYFQEKPTWSTEELSSLMQLPVSAIRRKAIFWQSNGILRETTNADQPDVTYLILIEDKDAAAVPNEEVIMEEETESAMASASDQREEKIQIVWSYIVGMLTNLDTLPLERIHAMLKWSVLQNPSTEVSIDELAILLERKVKEQKLIHVQGVYRLPK